MYCPRCGCEYREGFTRCTDCDLDLVEEPPEPPHVSSLPDITARTQGLFAPALNATLAVIVFVSVRSLFIMAPRSDSLFARALDRPQYGTVWALVLSLLTIVVVPALTRPTAGLLSPQRQLILLLGSIALGSLIADVGARTDFYFQTSYLGGVLLFASAAAVNTASFQSVLLSARNKALPSSLEVLLSIASAAIVIAVLWAPMHADRVATALFRRI